MASVLKRIVSGGQTGVDRGSLDAALGADFPCGGWCPRGRTAEDGTLNDRYPLVEAPVASYALRTRWNVRDSNGTLIISRGRLTGGTALTERISSELGRSTLIIDLDCVTPTDAVERIRQWLVREKIQTLNIAGPRESATPGIQHQTHAIVTELLRHIRQEERNIDEQAQFSAYRRPSPLGNSGSNLEATQSRRG